MSTSETFVLPPSDIWQARARLKGLVLHTPLVYSRALSRRTGCEIYLKMECWQVCGCFKVRGAINMVSTLSEAEKSRGLVTTSSGNHGIALAYAASLFGHPPTKVFLPQDADVKKLEKLRDLGAEIVLYGKNFLEAYDRAQQYTAETGATYVHSHDHPLIIAGQGTIGLEIMEDLPDVQAVITPEGGGGLLSGVATAVKSAAAGVRVFGVEPTAAPAAYLSLRDGVRYERIDVRPSVAHGLLGGFGEWPFKIVPRLVERITVVEDEEIIEAMRAFQQDEQLMVEGAASVGLAALLSGKIDLRGQKVALVITSRNIDADWYNRLIVQTSGK